MFQLEKIKKKLEEQELLVGANVLFDDSDISELFGFAGCDYVWIDLEHAPLNPKDVERHIIGAHAGGAAAFVRLPWNDMVMAKQILDMGPDGIIVPLIRSAKDARDAVEFCSYPPKGVRGWNPIRAVEYGCVDANWYIEHVDSLIWKILMIEHIDAVEDLEQILAVPGIDGIMIGPSDLTGSMGCLLQNDTPEFWGMIQRITQLAKAAGKVIGVALPADSSRETLGKWMDYGVQMVSVGQDANFLANTVRRNVQMAREAFTERD
ncbi:MAG: 4-hydroxy-3-methylbut-2-en-1-yl diphosphate synthase [Lachnospiraceae bacterium]|jgi:2-keto-3-deoxy-L-rhamnonate aldolase RhmA|nr:4-hydroxy-3-methylbut-2-en-1-yl diphosphate synthase [Lachnospiraceae bacterium]MCI8994763.1 4-hydroxy-3-methylbut-2-en-1-yl diphosphate synthase [Lachnospiraceae bacterium]MCI9133686.1 4-hydroxy-3-methylbut-2-en-1-yl diphosphate synthase [Lachnospiraceae bacterium]